MRASLAVLLALMSTACTTIDLQGHRGARGLYPENTLEGFERALALGVATLELDTGVTRDGVVVVKHDQRLNPEVTRGPDGKWIAAPGPLIASLAYDEIRHYDVGRIDPASEYARRFPHQQPIDGARVPRLADLFALAARLGAHDVRFNIETKIDPEQPDTTVDAATFAAALIAEIRRAGLMKRATIQSFDWRTLAIVQRDAPEIETVYLTAEQPQYDTIRRAQGASPWTAPIAFRDAGSVPRMVRAAGGRIWSPYFGNVDAAAREEARALGLRVIVWTVNEPADIERMLDLGVEGIISDYPDRVRDAMRRRGLALPAPVRPKP
jgi:glycerophosphoryl diester phosphodiesterase